VSRARVSPIFASTATAAELPKVKGQLHDGAMEGESTPTDVN
jgi:hypothetical protein